VLRHTLGTPTADDVVVFQDDDDYFFVNVSRTRTGRCRRSCWAIRSCASAAPHEPSPSVASAAS